MKDEIVVYRSKTGFTRKYAEWIAEELECECVPFESVTHEQLARYRSVVIGGCVRYEAVDAAKQIADMIAGLPDVVLFIVGATPMTDRKATGYMLKRTYNKSEKFRFVPHFYLQGGLNIKELGAVERMLIRLMVLIIKCMQKATPEMKEVASRMSHSADYSNRSNICALVEYVKSGRPDCEIGQPAVQDIRHRSH